MTAKRLSIPATILWVSAAAAAWLSRGALTTLSAQGASPRVAVTPAWGWLILGCGAAVGLASIRKLRTPEVVLLALTAIAALPWIPTRIPAVFLVWTGSLRIWLWTIVIVAAASSLIVRVRLGRAPIASVSDPRRAPIVAATAAAVLFAGGAWLVFPHLPAGDEPHYLVITQSLLRDRDLKIENNHQRGDYREYFGGTLRPDYLRRGTNGEIYSIHPTGLPVLVAPAFALGGYPAVLLFLALVSGAATSLSWIAVWRLTHNAGAAWFAWAAVSLSAPFFFQSFTVYPDAAGGAIAMLGLLAFCIGGEWSTRRLAALGFALALLPWLHTRFVLLEAALVAVLAARIILTPDGVRRTLALITAPLASTAAWCGFFYAIYGTPNPAAPYNGYTQSEIGNLVRGVPGLLFDAQFGVLANAPVFLCAIPGLWTLVRRRPGLAATLLAVIVPYTIAVAMYAMWWAGYSSPARFLVPVLLPLAIPIGVWFSSLRSQSAKLLACASLLLSVLITTTIAMVDGGGLLFNVRDGASRLLLWLSPVTDVTTAFPSLFRTSPSKAVADAVVWLAAIAAVVLLGRLVDRRQWPAPLTAAILGTAAMAAASAAITIVWRTNHAQPLTPATGGAAFLHAYNPDAAQVAIRYSPFRRLDAAAVPPMITLARSVPAERKADEPLIWAPFLAAGTYEIEARLLRPTTGRVSVILDREFGPAWSWSLEGARGWWRQTVSLPMPARVLLVDADADARGALQHASIRAARILGSRHRLAADEPWHVVRYGPAVVFLMGGHAYTEPGGTWVAGGEAADFVIVADPGAPISLFVRNAPVANRVTLESGSWRQDLSLAPREERSFDVPLDPSTLAAKLRIVTSAGARPSEFEHSDDTRMLGCWIETR